MMIWYGAEKYEIVGRRQEMIRGNRQRPGERSKPGVAKGGGYLVIFAVAGPRNFIFFCFMISFVLNLTIIRSSVIFNVTYLIFRKNKP